MTSCRLTRIVEFDMGHRIKNHESKCRNPHGHRYRVEASVIGPVINDASSSSDGMVIDFGVVKDVLMREVHDRYDHGFMFEDSDDAMATLFDAHPDYKAIRVTFAPTAENIAREAFLLIRDALPLGLSLEGVRVFETPNNWVDYRE